MILIKLTKVVISPKVWKLLMFQAPNFKGLWASFQYMAYRFFIPFIKSEILLHILNSRIKNLRGFSSTYFQKYKLQKLSRPDRAYSSFYANEGFWPLLKEHYLIIFFLKFKNCIYAYVIFFLRIFMEAK